jgi:two-component system chemotaxis response regulator CheB
MENKLRVLVVDDTVIYRKIVSMVLADLPYVEVVGTAPHGRIALQKIEQLRPDLLTLDLEMPEMDGLAVLRELRSRNIATAAIMLSAFTTQGAQFTVEALELGAFDFVLKPTGSDAATNEAKLRRELTNKLEAFSRTRIGRAASQRSSAAPRPARETAHRAEVPFSAAPRAVPAATVNVVAIGISTGGPVALSRMLPQLPADLSVPVLVVQHMPPIFTRSLAEDLNKRCRLNVVEAVDGQFIQAGNVLIAPGGQQMKVESAQGQVRVRITNDPPENSCRPAVDYLLRSVAAVYGETALAIIMTGMGSDGAAGCRHIKEHRGTVLAQEAASCVVYGMPREVAERGIADALVPLEEIAPTIVRMTNKSSPRTLATCR